MALRPTWLLSLAGQASTHNLQPVQSSGAIASVYFMFRKFFPASIGRYPACGGVLQESWIVDLLADDSMRANEDALAALDAQVRFPNRNFQRDIALFPLGCCRGIGAIDGHRADWQAVAFSRDDRTQHIADEFGRLGGPERGA